VTENTQVVTMPAATSYELLSLTNNTAYKITVTATNIFGEGSAATEITRTTLSVPTWTDGANEPSLAQTAGSSDVTISWSVPELYTSTLQSYQVLFLMSDATEQESSLCDGSDSGIITARSCTVSIESLKAFTSKALNDPIQVQIKAISDEGESVLTTATQTIVYQSAPTTYPVVATMTATPKDVTGDDVITVTWVHLADNTDDVGRNDVTKYLLEAKKVLLTDWTAITAIEYDSSATVDGATITQDFAGLDTLTEYEFRLSAFNAFAYGPTTPDGSEVSAKTYGIPATMTKPTLS